jgi:hypothetical protein
MTAREDLRKDFTEPNGELNVLVLSYITSNEGLNLHPQCHHNIMVEQGVNYAQEHQAWSRVRRIGQTKLQITERLVNLETVDAMIERSQRERQNPMLHALGIMDNIPDKTIQAGAIYDALIGKQSAEVLKDMVLGDVDLEAVPLLS